MKERETFFYRYSAAENREIQEIRKKYLPVEENKMEKLKKLDRYVQTAGRLPSITLGVGGCLLLGLGSCLAARVIGGTVIGGVLLGVAGAVGMIAAYPVFRSVSRNIKAKYAPRILKLAEELMRK